MKLMRLIYLLLVLTLVSYINFGQTKPLIIKGKFDNCTVGQIYIAFKTGLEETVRDSIKINSDGSFFYKTYQCQIPQKTSPRNIGFYISDLLVAPGYEMTITGNAKDYKTLLRTTSITGIGSCVRLNNTTNYSRLAVSLMLPSSFGLTSLNYLAVTPNNATFNKSASLAYTKFICTLLSSFEIRISLMASVCI